MRFDGISLISLSTSKFLAVLHSEIPVIPNLRSYFRPQKLRLEIMKMYYDIKRSGNCIRQLRTQRGYTQERLAGELNIDRSLISHIEAGKRGCSVDLLVRLSEFFGVSLDLLVLGREQSAPLNTFERELLKTDMARLIGHLEEFQNKL